jgi:nicotinamidase-related amidase
MQRDALLVIDAQVNQFEGAGAVADAPQILARLKKLVDAAREGGAPVFWVQNDGGPEDPDYPETPGWLLHPELVPQEGEPVLRKTTCDVFQSTDIGRRLGDRNVEEVVIAGLQSNWCIRESSRGAVDHGFDLALVVDAHSTMEGGGDGSGRSAAEIRKAINEELWEIGRQLSTDEAVARWKTRRTHPEAP